MKKITGKDLLRIGFEENSSLGTALHFCNNYTGILNKEQLLNSLKNTVESPEQISDASEFFQLAGK